jgi:hypothetical protein
MNVCMSRIDICEIVVLECEKVLAAIAWIFLVPSYRFDQYHAVYLVPLLVFYAYENDDTSF